MIKVCGSVFNLFNKTINTLKPLSLIMKLSSKALLKSVPIEVYRFLYTPVS